jgi:16S rRNA (guanine527-N7)-methyltransferase
MTGEPDLAALTDQLEEARRLGFFGPRPVSEQIDHASAFAAVLEDCGAGPASFLDLGSGGGLPGLLLAARWGSQTGTLLDASARRTAFLSRAVVALGFAGRISVLEGRAEVLGRELGARAAFALIVSRSFAAPAVTAEVGGAFVRLGGVLAVSEPGDRDADDRWPAEGLERLGFSPAVLRQGVGARVAIMTRTAPLDDRWPRAVGIPTKRPLW